MAVDLANYVDVATRISQFNERYPEGTLQMISWTVEEVDGQTFIVYRAAAYRTPDDERPGMGIAWEPFPGKTSFTRDSELMNAETSAWGRAIVACGLTSNGKIASAEEVRARSADAAEPETNGHQPTAKPAVKSERAITANQREELLKPHAREAGLTAGQFANVILAAKGEEPREWRSGEHAKQTLDFELDRLPARLKDAVLEGIDKAGNGASA